MSEAVNKTILLLTELSSYNEGDAIPVLRPGLNQDNYITLDKIVWFDETTNQLIVNGRYRFDMSGLVPNNITITLTGDSGITNFTYNGQIYEKNLNIENSETTIDAIITANVDSNYTFNKWQFNNVDISENNPLSHLFTESGVLRAITTSNLCNITIEVNNPLSGTVSGDGNYDYGASCTVTATANSGFTFTNWTENGSVVSTQANYTFTVTGNRTLVANFTASFSKEYSIRVAANPRNGGNVSGGGTYSLGEECTVGATANKNYTFVNWTIGLGGEEVSTNAEYKFNVVRDLDLYANFVSNKVDYYIGQALDNSTFNAMTDILIVSNALAHNVSLTPIYPSVDGYEYFSNGNKLFYVLFREDLYDILFDVDNEVDLFDLTDQTIANIDTENHSSVLHNNIRYKVVATYDYFNDSSTGYRVKFTNRE